MTEAAIDRLTPKVTTWTGLIFLSLLLGFGFQFFGKDIAIGMGVGVVVGLANFKAIVIIVKQFLGPDGLHKVLYGIFGFLKFSILASVFFLLIYYKLFDVLGIVAGFTAVLLCVLIEGLIRAARFTGGVPTEEKGNA